MKHYNLSLTPSPSAVGYAVCDNSLNLVQLVHHKPALGSRLFTEGESKADRRLFRAAWRNNRRTKGRIKALNSVMEKEINKVDPTFFDRLNQSGLSPLDQNKKYRTVIFDKPAAESYYHKKFPTVYHLENYLMTTDEKADIRLVYWALHSLLTNRGHFFNSTPVSQFKPGTLSVKDKMLELESLNTISDLDYAVENAPEIEHVLKQKNVSKKNKIKQLKEDLFETASDRNIQKRNDKIATAIGKAILGNKFQFNEIIGITADKNERKSWSIQLSDKDLDTKIDELSEKVNNDQLRILEILQEIYASVALLDVLQGASSLVEAKIRSYDKYKKDLHLFFKVLNNMKNKDASKTLKEAYTLYIGNHHRDLLEARKDLGVNTATNFARDDFYKLINKTLSNEDDQNVAKVKELIKKGDFLKKQRVSDNAYVPYQLNAIVVNKILENQGKYYPFLVEPNPALPDRKEAPYKISQLIQFTIPYYVGPLATPAEQKNLPEGSKFAWLVRKEKGRITPWNFYEKVDVMATADAFIKRSIGKDTYLLSEPVLPQSSLLYQKYTVLNELSNISLVDANTKKVNKPNANVKQLLYRECFKKKVTVTKQFAMKVLNDNNIFVSDIEGLSDGKRFTSALTTYNSWKKHFPEEIDNPHFTQDLENMIEWSSVFEDRKILADKLKQEFDWLTNDQFKFVVESRLTGWGRFSKKLLVGLKDAKGKSIMDNLYNTKKNFNQIIAQAAYRSQIDEIAYRTTQNQSLDDILDAMYASPANRKAIRQTLKVVEEVVSLAKSAPDKIFVTFQRSKEQEGKLVDNRATQLLKIYRGIKDPLVDSDLIDQLSKAVYAKDPRDKVTNKRYLYFQQLGRDALTGEVIDPARMNEYSVLHIIPRSKIIDDSINNLVLTRIKSHSDSLIKEFGNKKISGEKITVKQFWNKLNNLGLLSKAKLNNLEVDLASLNQYQMKGYIARQLVETNQVTKGIAMILQTKYPHSKIIEVRHDQIANIRYCFDLYRIKNLNAYYRAMDAYIVAVAGTYMYAVYPKARRFFVYGEYLKPKTKQKPDSNLQVTGHGFNFLWRLLYGKEDEIYVQGTNDIAFSREDLIDKLKQVYNFKYQNISIATATKRANMFNQTLYPRHERDVQKTRTLIRKKKNLDTDIYGGYTGNVNSFFVLVQIKRKNKPDKFNLYGVPRRFLDVLEASKSTGNYEQKLHEIVDLIVKSNNAKMAGYRIIKDKVPYYQVILDEGSKFCITSAQYRYNCRQLILSQEAQKSLMDYVVDPNFYQHKKTKDAAFDKDTKLIKVYDEILYQVDTYLPLYTIRSINTKLKKARSAFVKCSLKDKAYVLERLLISFSANPTMPDLKPIGLTPLTLVKKNCPLTENAVFLCTSPTGMKTKEVSIKQLIGDFND